MDYRAGMLLYALAFLLGAVFVQQLSALPDISWFILLLICLLALCLVVNYFVFPSSCNSHNRYLFKSYFTLISVFILLIIIGFIYTLSFAKQQLDYRLDEFLVGQNIIVTGTVSSIPVSTGKDSQRFELTVDAFRVLQPAINSLSPVASKAPEKLRLSWFYGVEVNAGEQWQLEVRLKPPHGFLNPGGFDYEGWLFQQGIHGTGYIRKSEVNRRLQAASRFSINSIRQSLGRQIDELANRKNTAGEERTVPAMALLKALAIGDKSSITAQQWRILSNTGTSHLMAISGLHIGLAALFGYLLIRHCLPAFIMKRLPAQHVALVSSLLLALLYALIAGLSIPTQRAVIMLSVLSVMLLLRRNSRPVDSLGLALLLVLVFDPVAVLSAGFWFSFSAVAVIYISVTAGDKAETGILVKLGMMMKHWLQLQLMISLFLLPLSLFMFQQGSLVSPLANLLLIPYVSFLVVPLVLLAIICSFVLQDISGYLFNLAATLLDFIWPLLSYLSQQSYAFWVKGDVLITDLLLASAAMLLLYFSTAIVTSIEARSLETRFLHLASSKGRLSVLWSFRLLVGLLFVPLLMTAKPVLSRADYQVTILDVGQGSAAVIRTLNHVVVFDSGTRFSDRMDAGGSVVVPYLRSQGIKRLDRLIISHGDMDHIGGAQTILDSYPEADLVGQDIEGLRIQQTGVEARQHCYAGMQWQWDGVFFEFISPEKKHTPDALHEKRNNRSCVLRVSSPSGVVLFTGDIEKTVENQLLQNTRELLPADVLIVPHHGSNSSSSRAFIALVDPQFAIISAGYNNRYQLPSDLVTTRYAAINSGVLTTAKSGAVIVTLRASQEITLERYRETAKKYWHHESN